MKTYPEIVTEYMKDTLKGMLDEFSEYTDVDFLCEKIYFLFLEDEFLSGIRNTDEAKERVLANIEYVMDSVNENTDSWEYKGRWFAEKDWNELDCSAMLTALDDVCDDVAKWFYDELRKANPAKPKYKHEYVFLSIKHAFQISFYDLTETQLYQIMQNNPEFILSGINRLEVK